jgi:Flp pilus assembly protein TadD
MGRRYYSSTYARWVGIRHIRKMHSASSEDRRIEAAKEAIAWLERARRGRRERKNKRRERWTELDEFGDLLIRAQIAPVALVAGDLDKASRYANDALRTRDAAVSGGAPAHVDWGADQSYVAHIVLGKIALSHGDVGAASEHLRLASRSASRSSPTLSSLGPDTELVAALLKHGEKRAVVDYLRAMREVWRPGARQLDLLDL